jgi:hypothetical protein
MKRFVLVPLLLFVLVSCGKPNTPAPPALAQDAKTAADALNAVSVISVTALAVAKTLPQVPPATVTAIGDGVRTYNCALLDDGYAAPMPPPATGTVSDSCHAHGDKMLGILSKIQTAGSAATLHALAIQGLTYAQQTLAKIAATANADLLKYVTVAQTALAVIASWS